MKETISIKELTHWHKENRKASSTNQYQKIVAVIEPPQPRHSDNRFPTQPPVSSQKATQDQPPTPAASVGEKHLCTCSHNHMENKSAIGASCLKGCHTE